MNTIIRILIITILIVFSTKYSNAQKISKIQQQVLQDSVAVFAQSYIDLMQLVSKKGLPTTVKIEKVKAWFNNKDFFLENTIALDSSKQFLTIEEYVNTIENDYPAGIIFTGNVKTDIEITAAKKEQYKNSLSVAIPIEISQMGIYKGKRILKNQQEIYLIFSFSKKGKKDLKKFQFENIQKENNLYPLIDYFYQTAGINLGLTPYSDYSMHSDYFNYASMYNIEQNKIPLDFGISFYKSLGRFFGFNIGVNYNKRESSLSWKNTEENFYISVDYRFEPSTLSPQFFLKDYYSLFKDADGDSFLPFLTVNGLEDIRSIKTIIVPVNFEFKLEKSEKFSFYLFAGIQFRYKLSTEGTVKGELSIQGYYPEYDFTLHDLPDYGYTTNVLDTSFLVKSKMFYFVPYGGLGLKVYFSKVIGLNLQVLASAPGLVDAGRNYILEKEEKPYHYSPENIFPSIYEELNIAGDFGKNAGLSFTLGVNLSLFYKF